MITQILTAQISQSAKLLGCALYAQTGDNADAAAIMDMIGIQTAGALRHLRAEIADAGIATTRIDAGVISWQWGSSAARPTDARVPQTRTADAAARPTDARVPQTRTADAAARPTDAQDDAVTPVTPAAARPTDAQCPPRTPHREGGLIKYIKRAKKETLPPHGEGVPGERNWQPSEHSNDGYADRPPIGNEHRHTQKLLMSVGMSQIEAGRLAAMHGFYYCLAVTLDWDRQRSAGEDIGIGALSYRIKNSWHPPAPSRDDRLSSPIYLDAVFGGEKNRALVAYYSTGV